MKKLLLICLVFISGCSGDDDILLDPYENAIMEVMSANEFDDVTNFNVETLLDKEDNSFYVVIDNPVDIITDLKVVAVPVINGEKVGQVPQFGYLDSPVVLDANQPGIILNGELSKYNDNLLILLKVEYSINGKKYVQFIKNGNLFLLD